MVEHLIIPWASDHLTLTNFWYFHCRSGCISNDMDDIGCTNKSAGAPETPAVEPKVLVAKEVDFKEQETLAPVLLDSSTNTLEKGYRIEPVSTIGESYVIFHTLVALQFVYAAIKLTLALQRTQLEEHL